MVIALLAAGLTAAALSTFGGYLSSGRGDVLQVTEVLGAPGAADAQEPLPGLALHIAFSADGRSVIARQNDGKVVAWDRGDGTGRLLAHTNGAFAYCAAGERLVISNENAAVALSLRDGGFEPVAKGPHDHAAFSADCETLALAGASDAEVLLLREAAGDARLRTAQPVRNGLSLSPDGAHLAAAGGVYTQAGTHRTTIEVFDLMQPAPAARLIADGDAVMGLWAMQFEPKGRSLFLGSQVFGQSGLRRIDPESGKVVWGHDGFESYWVRGLAVAPGGTYLATGDEQGWLRLWDTETGILLNERQAGQVIQALAFSPDGSWLAVSMWDGTIGLVPLGSLT
ncbi:MAG: hypothetical protein AAGH68_03120 [Pseudomonadota bacterium]